MSRGERGPGLTLPLPLAVALRYLKSTRRDAFVSFLSAAAVGGLALGVTALILALAALTGFQEALKLEILARTPEIEIAVPAGEPAGGVRDLVAAHPGVRSAELLVRGQGWLVGQGAARPVELTGYERRPPSSFPVPEGGGPGLYVGDRLAGAWGLEPGDALEIASSRPTLSPLGPQPRVRRLPLAGTFATGRTEVEDRVALPLAAAEALLGGGDYRVVASTGALDRALGVAAELAAKLPPGSRVRTWRDLNRGLFFALKLEKSLMFVAVFLIVLVAGLALVSNVTLIVASKRAEIGMLGAMGARPGALQAIFLLLGVLQAVGGVALGALLGVGGAWLLDRYRLIEIPGSVYFLDYVPFQARPADLALVLGAALALAVGCALLPARKAVALEPVEALRR